MPEMQKLYEQYQAQDLVILGVDVQESSPTITAFTTEGGFKWTFLRDANGRLADHYMVSGLPSHVFIDRRGIVQAIHIGGLENAGGRKAPVEEYLQKIFTR